MSQSAAEAATAAELRARFAPELPAAVKARVAEINGMMQAATPPATEVPAGPLGGQEQREQEGGEGAPALADVEGRGSQPKPDARQDSPSTEAPQNAELEALKRRLADAEQEARTWKGRATKTSEEIRTLGERVADLSERLEEASRVPAAPDPAALSEEERDNYGADLLEVTRRNALHDLKDRLAVALAPLLKRLDALEQGVGSVQADTAKSAWEKFCDKITAKIPNWKEIDTSEPFVQWLDEEDELFGEQNRKALERAAQNMDDKRAVKVFERFLAQTGGSQESPRGTGKPKAPPAGTEQKEAPSAPEATAPPTPAPQPALEDLAAPGRPASSPSSAPLVQPGAKVWTAAEITEYYRTRSNGTHPHARDPVKALAMDREIAQAQREGRVTA